jgi:hypothetical protein
MGIRDLFTTPKPTTEITVDAASTPAPFNNTASFNPFVFTQSVASRQQAMAVPTIARARGILCSTLASLPMEQYSKLNGSHLGTPAVINQPDPRVPGSAVYAWLAEDLFFMAVGYGQVLEQYGDTGRVRSWTRVAPDRVTQKLNHLQTEIIGYQVDGSVVQQTELVLSLYFTDLDEGILNRAGRTIRAAHALNKLQKLSLKNQFHLQVLKSNGTNLPAERISKLLNHGELLVLLNQLRFLMLMLNCKRWASIQPNSNSMRLANMSLWNWLALATFLHTSLALKQHQ